jgi:hypothetical protein
LVGTVLTLRSTDYSPLQIDIDLQPPGLYLDSCVIADLAKDDQARGVVIRDGLLSAGGTLYLSWGHLLEFFGFGKGPTYDAIRNYLASYGRHFVIIDCHAQAVINREKIWTPGKQNPAIDEDFLEIIGQEWEGRSGPTIAALFDFMMEDPELQKNYKRMHREHKGQIKPIFEGVRQRYKLDRNYKKTLNRAQYPYTPPGPPTESIYYAVMRECIRTNEVFTESDSLDFEHAVVSLSYCTFVVLDKKWARRIRRLPLPKVAARIFDGTELNKLEQVLQTWNVIRATAATH